MTLLKELPRRVKQCLDCLQVAFADRLSGNKGKGIVIIVFQRTQTLLEIPTAMLEKTYQKQLEKRVEGQEFSF